MIPQLELQKKLEMEKKLAQPKKGYGDVLDEETERVAREIVDAAFRVHSNLGPGLVESVYVQCLVLELEAKGLRVRREVKVPIVYMGHTIEPGLRLDLLVEERIIIEAKAVDVMNPVFKFKLKTYLTLSHMRLGFLINFNVPLIKDGISRIIL
jgi:GxxExxY protein